LNGLLGWVFQNEKKITGGKPIFFYKEQNKKCPILQGGKALLTLYFYSFFSSFLVTRDKRKQKKKQTKGTKTKTSHEGRKFPKHHPLGEVADYREVAWFDKAESMEAPNLARKSA